MIGLFVWRTVISRRCLVMNVELENVDIWLCVKKLYLNLRGWITKKHQKLKKN